MVLMFIQPDDLLTVLRNFNPWWSSRPFPALPDWRRAAFTELASWLSTPPAHRALLISGARQVGKTTLMLQAIQFLIEAGVPPGNILYATLDHPLLKLAGVEAILKVWREIEASADGPEFLFLDEIQFQRDWQVWIKHQVDFQRRRRIVATGSASPLVSAGQESGVGRWHVIRLPTLSFFEYLQIRRIPGPDLTPVRSLREIFSWKPSQFSRASACAADFTAMFHEYLLRGGFPQAALAPTLEIAQRLLREDIVDKVLKRDMTALFGVRRVLELEQTFLYLCLHDGGLLDLKALSSGLSLPKPTASNFVAHLEAANLIHRLRPFGYGKEILRAHQKVYLADPAIGPSVLLRGKEMLEDEDALGRAVETAFFKHVFTRFYRASVGFSYWRGKKSEEVDIVAETEGKLVPFEVKYRRAHTGSGDLKGIVNFCRERRVDRGYVITRSPDDFQVLAPEVTGDLRLLKIPAVLACYWLGQSEHLDPAPNRQTTD